MSPDAALVAAAAEVADELSPLPRSLPSRVLAEAIERHAFAYGDTIRDVAARSGLAERKLRGIVKGEKQFKNVNFRTADRLVTYGLGGPHLWWVDDELRFVYLGGAARSAGD